ncbi:hypothetical protein Pmani_023764 [Petrolisthes manimaculis]|uniref:Uncharacterized protein n=1 Tax=Petrolisthes manimaculis TaxID=1843537 RepID=A0AAE1PA18_9EUCA|nr:hypothetical protein Pmani_023764 [Petrolisthes manimaculis]
MRYLGLMRSKEALTSLNSYCQPGVLALGESCQASPCIPNMKPLSPLPPHLPRSHTNATWPQHYHPHTDTHHLLPTPLPQHRNTPPTPTPPRPPNRNTPLCSPTLPSSRPLTPTTRPHAPQHTHHPAPLNKHTAPHMHPLPNPPLCSLRQQ